MDVSRSEAQRAETNVIARSDDRATISQRRPNVRTHHGASYRRHGYDKRHFGESRTSMHGRRLPIRPIGRTVVRPYIASSVVVMPPKRESIIYVNEFFLCDKDVFNLAT
jgi:hypothetical protein